MAGPNDVDSKLFSADDALFSATGKAGDSRIAEKKKAAVDLQALDDRLRRAVLDGDVTYVQSRLGDRKLSEAESVLLIRARQEAEEKVVTALTAQDAQASAERKEEEQANLMTFFYNGNRSALYNGNQRGAVLTSGRDMSDRVAPVIDSNGQKYYSDFGYDTRGNYRTSYGEVVSPEGIVRSENGGETDLSRGIYTRDRNTYNAQTGEAITFNPVTGRYIHSRKVNGKDEVINPDLTEEEAQRLKEQMLRTNRVSTPEEVRAILQEQQQQDAARPHPAADTANSREGNETPSTLAHQNSTASDAGSGSREPSTGAPESRPGPAPAPAPAPPPHAGTVAGAGIGGSIVGAMGREAESTFDNVLSQVNGLSADRNRLAGRRDNERARRATAAQSTLPKGADSSAIAATWVAAGASLPAPKPGQDYVDNRDGLHKADGTYMDYKNNVVDKHGNLWLANDKSGKPSFTKREGVDYTELLMARAEGPAGLKRWVDADPARAAALQDVNAALQKLDDARTERARATSAENWVYSSRGNYVDKFGAVWIAGELKSHGESGGADYIEMLRLAEKGKLDQWKSTGTLKKEEIEAIKEAVRTNEANLTARGYNLRKELMGVYSTTQSRFVPPTEQKPETTEPVTQDQTVSLKRATKAASTPT